MCLALLDIPTRPLLIGRSFRCAKCYTALRINVFFRGLGSVSQSWLLSRSDICPAGSVPALHSEHIPPFDANPSGANGMKFCFLFCMDDHWFIIHFFDLQWLTLSPFLCILTKKAICRFPPNGSYKIFVFLFTNSLLPLFQLSSVAICLK